MRRLVLFLLVLLPLAPARAEAVTVRDIIELTHAGLGDDVLLALIEVDQSVFAIDAATLTRLKEAGVSDRVILAMVRSGRTPAPAADAQLPPPVSPDPVQPVVVIDHHETVREVSVPVAVPVYVPVVPVAPGRLIDHAVAGDRFADRRIDRPFLEREREKQEPVYWGWGGKLRPDAWKPKQDPNQ
jgi:hypothetical protein